MITKLGALLLLFGVFAQAAPALARDRYYHVDADGYATYCPMAISNAMDNLMAACKGRGLYLVDDSIETTCTGYEGTSMDAHLEADCSQTNEN